MSSGSPGNGFLQGLGISAGLISAPILIGIGMVLAIVMLCCFCFFGTAMLGAIGNTIPTPVP